MGDEGGAVGIPSPHTLSVLLWPRRQQQHGVGVNEVAAIPTIQVAHHVHKVAVTVMVTATNYM